MSGGKRRGGHEEEHEEHENHERWLVSYADMMTLLMVLFIVMFAISQVDARKFMALKTGLEAGFGAPVSFVEGADHLLETGDKLGQDSPNLGGVAGRKNSNPNEPPAGAAPGSNSTDKVSPEKVAELANATSQAQVKAEVQNLKKAQEELKKALAAAGKADGATFRFNEQGLVVTIATDKVMFDSGSATLLPGGRKILDALAPTLKGLPNRLSIDGHTDSNPISTSTFPSNWELSTGRATGVLRYLQSAHRIPFSRMFATGYADTRPLKEGTSARAMSANRRVEIIVVARVDDSLGRAVETLGNSTPIETTATASPSPGTTPSASPSTTTSTTPPTTTSTSRSTGASPSGPPRTTRSTPSTRPATRSSTPPGADLGFDTPSP